MVYWLNICALSRIFKYFMNKMRFSLNSLFLDNFFLHIDAECGKIIRFRFFKLFFKFWFQNSLFSLNFRYSVMKYFAAMCSLQGNDVERFSFMKISIYSSNIFKKNENVLKFIFSSVSRLNLKHIKTGKKNQTFNYAIIFRFNICT